MQSRPFPKRMIACARFFSQNPKRLVDMTNRLLPRSTGAGPFVELPTIEPIGEPGTVLKIQLPQSSTLNIRTTSITALNGNISEISSEFKSLTPKIWYQSVRPASPMSLLVSGTTSGANNYSVINIKKGDQWELANADNLVAWSGFDLSIKPKPNGLRTSLHCEGTGFLVINGYHNLLDLTVGVNEKLLLNPNSLVASNVNLARLARLGATDGHRFSIRDKIPALIQAVYSGLSKRIAYSLKSTIANLKSALGPSGSTGVSAQCWQERLGKLQRWLSLTIKSRFFYSAPLYYSIVGPARILVIDRCQVPNRLNFTKTQIVDNSNL